MVENPFTSEATVSGADAVYTYDQAKDGYQATTLLEPGQGAWVYSATGGTATITAKPQ